MECDDTDPNRRDSLVAVAEKIKFQITIEEPEEEEESEQKIDAATGTGDEKP